MDLEKLKFIITENGDIKEENKESLLTAYKEVFKEIYGYDILTEYEKAKPKLKNEQVFNDTFIKSIDVIKSVKNDKNISLLTIYNEENDVIGFGRLKNVQEVPTSNPLVSIINGLMKKHMHIEEEKCISVPDIAILPKYNENRYEIWKKAISFIETFVTSQGYDKMYVEIPLNSPLLFRADDLGFIEDPEDVPISVKPRTRILNKSLERNKDAEFNNCR